MLVGLGLCRLVLGHDAEIKQTYEALIRSDQRPVLFIDVGANYGTHSLLFLAAGIPIIAFEPNPECFPQFQEVCGLNHLGGRWEQSALGRETGQIYLVYPETETWLGSTSGEVISKFHSSSVAIKRVPIRMLDDYLCEMPIGELLVKLDVEGSEIEVLKGASNSWIAARRKSYLRAMISRRDPNYLPPYRIWIRDISLPLRKLGEYDLLGDEFLQNHATDFIAKTPDSPERIFAGLI